MTSYARSQSKGCAGLDSQVLFKEDVNHGNAI